MTPSSSPPAPETRPIPHAPRPVVLVTGAAGGLGLALTDAFLARGWHVAAAGHQKPPEIVADHVTGFAVELADAGSVARLFADVDARCGRLDALVVNAAITADGLLAQLPVAAWDACMDVDLRGAFLCAREAARRMAAQGDGHIVQVGSLVARGAVGQAAYAAAKAGLLGLGASLARELGDRNVRVNTVWPGVLDTPMTAGLSAGRRAALRAANVLGRWNDPEEVARFVAHLAETRNISGQVFQLDSRIGRWA